MATAVKAELDNSNDDAIVVDCGHDGAALWALQDSISDKLRRTGEPLQSVTKRLKNGDYDPMSDNWINPASGAC